MTADDAFHGSPKACEHDGGLVIAYKGDRGYTVCRKCGKQWPMNEPDIGLPDPKRGFRNLIDL